MRAPGRRANPHNLEAVYRQFEFGEPIPHHPNYIEIMGQIIQPEIDRMLAAARTAGAISGKVCGAGGGGCLFCFAEPDAIPAVRQALADNGARVLDFTVEARGLVIDTF